MFVQIFATFFWTTLLFAVKIILEEGGIEDNFLLKSAGIGFWTGLVTAYCSLVFIMKLAEVNVGYIVLTILGVTSKKANHGSFAGLVIGFTLTLVHILGIGLTGTSVNPARSFGPALVAAFSGNAAPLVSLWVFIVGPLVGAALAAVVYKFLED